MKTISTFAKFFVRLPLLAVLAFTGIGLSSAQAQNTTNVTNSTVRFRLTYGTTLLGDIDVELFDSDKPTTVSNFLAYAQSGKYTRSILHHLIPGIAVLGGGFTVPSTVAASPFQLTTLITAFPAITNEFAVGTPRSNVFGTLAMAKELDAPNSARSQWFFNLGDNSRGTGNTNFNTANGGYTVFGQIKTGAQVLQSLNSRVVNNGIINMLLPNYQTFCSQVFVDPSGPGYPFPALPVGFTSGFNCPTYADLLAVEIIQLNVRDVLPPTVTIIAPAKNASLTNADVVARGAVADNTAVASVRVYRGTNPPVDALVTNGTWTATLTNVSPGTNIILVEAVDTTGLRGQAQQTFFHSVRAALTLGVVGAGKITGATDQQRLELGRGYRLTAKPDLGNLFVGWTGSLASASMTLGFLMETNLSLTAVFATNLFPTVRGTFNGLFHNPVEVEQESSGFITLTLANSGTYSAKISMNGRTYPMKGTFSADGTETNTVTRAGTNSLLVILSLDLTNGTDQITGTVTNNQVTAIDTNRGWWADLVADRAVFTTPLNVSPHAGRYTLLIPPDTNSVAGPPADGFGALTVSTKGAVAFAGMLPDGTKISQKTGISKGGAWPFYVALAKGRGALVSWLTISNLVETDLSGLLNWFKQTQPGVKYYSAGLTNETLVVGSAFIPATTNRVLTLSTAVVGFTNGNLAADFANDIILGADGKAANQDTNKLTLTISKSTGLFSGSVTPPAAKKAIPFKGAVLQQKGNRGAGFFLGTNAAGRVIVAE